MCVVSMVSDHYLDKWTCKRDWQINNPGIYPPYERSVTPEEIEEFRRLLERAREYDKKHNQPDCELQEKKDKLLKLADELGVEITFL